jgi:ABC-type antimicrobial peptide transport system permease subunit
MVSQRTREIGIRMALGANRAAVVAMVLREAAVVGGAAIVFGVLATLPLPKIFAGMFNGLGQASAMAVLIGTPISVAVVVLAASAVPCLRAARTSPAGALRWE